MGPEAIVIAVGIYAVIFAGIGLLLGVFVKRGSVLASAVGSMALVFGLVNGAFAPSPDGVYAGIMGFVFSAVVIGIVALLVHIIRRADRGANEHTAL